MPFSSTRSAEMRPSVMRPFNKFWAVMPTVEPLIAATKVSARISTVSNVLNVTAIEFGTVCSVLTKLNSKITSLPRLSRKIKTLPSWKPPPPTSGRFSSKGPNTSIVEAPVTSGVPTTSSEVPVTPTPRPCWPPIDTWLPSITVT